MGETLQRRRVLLICAIFSRHDEALAWARDTAEKEWGPAIFTSPLFDFSETKFYKKEMGEGLQKQLLAFENLIDLGSLPGHKLTSNKWEQAYTESHDYEEVRPLNIDPGYLTEAKLVLATTKHRDHRIYLSQGIFAEVTLFFQGNQWQSSRWTYPDYRREDFQSFFTKCRAWLREKYRADSGQ